MDLLNKWFEQFSNTPAGAILMFVAVFLMRVFLDERSRKREQRRGDKHRKRPA